MPYRTLDNLPPPSPGRHGWPWTDGDPDEQTPEGSALPRVTVVTPSYNQGAFLEETIRSVLLQGYSNLEYIIIDGGSSDESVSIIEKYSAWIDYWVSEPDGGQTNAINKGWRWATGKYITWLNSDDLLLPGSLQKAVAAIEESYADIVYGDALLVDERSQPRPHPYQILRAWPFDYHDMLVHWRNPIPQQGFLMDRDLLHEVGYLDESFNYTMDFEYWVRLALHGKKGQSIAAKLAAFRQHEEAKTSNLHLNYIQDRHRIYEKVFSDPKIPGTILALAEHSKQNRDQRALYISLLAANSRLVRQYAWTYLNSTKLPALPLFGLALLLSLSGERGMRILRKLFRQSRVLIAKRLPVA